MKVSKQLFERLKNNGLDFFVSVPCKFLDDLISLLSNDREVIHTPVTREEEGVGLAAGAFLAGRRPAVIMQNSGLGNSINAICSLLNYYQIPVVFILSHRGVAGEIIDAQRPMGRATSSLLDSADIPYLEISSSGSLAGIDDLVRAGLEDNKPVALLFPPCFWKKETEAP